MRSLIVVAVFLTLSLGLVMADQFQGTIKKLDAKANKLTIMKGANKKKDIEGTEVTLDLDSKVKVTKGKFSKDGDKFKIEAGDPVEEGLKSELLAEGKNVTVVTDDTSKKVTGIILGFGGKGKKKE